MARGWRAGTVIVVAHGNPAVRTWVGDKRLRLQAWVYANFTHCWRCGEPVDFAWRETNPRHPKAPSVDHVLSRKARPDLVFDRGNARLAHIGCNSAYGDGTRQVEGRTSSSRW